MVLSKNNNNAKRKNQHCCALWAPACSGNRADLLRKSPERSHAAPWAHLTSHFLLVSVKFRHSPWNKDEIQST